MCEIVLNYIINNQKGKFLDILEDKIESISTDFIKDIFYKKLNENFEKIANKINLNIYDISKNNISYEHIRYYSSEFDSLVLLLENKEYKLDKNKKNIFLIKVNIEREKEKNIRQQFIQLNDQIDDLSNKVNNIYFKNLYKNYKMDNDDSEVDIAVLTSNPLINKKYNKELKTMNDFNKIAKSIYETIKNKAIIVEFLPLTENNLNKIIQKKPKILHLICKSTYIIDNNDFEGKTSYNYVNLIFEENDYFEMREIKKTDLDIIFENNLIQNTLLIISTQLAEDVYNMVKNYKFKNILIQHTTNANAFCIENFNKRFYSNILMEMGNSLNYECFDNAKSVIDLESKNNINGQFCCCHHQHELNCHLFLNLKNELYICDNIEEIEIQKYMPHFSHLTYKKENNKKCCCKKGGNNNNFQCEKKDIFYHNFLEKINIIKLGYGKNGNCLINNIDCIPNSDIISGRNKIIYDLYNELFNFNDTNRSLINIYTNRYNISELIKLVDIIIGYFKERINLVYYDEIDNDYTLTKRPKSYNNIREISNESNELRKITSSPIFPICSNIHKDYKFKKIFLKEDFKHNIYNNRNEFKFIYFIIVLNEDMIEKINLNKFEKSIFFTKNELKSEKFKKIKLEPKNRLNYLAQYENKKIKYLENDFNIFIEQNLENDINKINKSKIKSEILYLFHLINSEINEMNLKKIFEDNQQKYNEEIIKEFENLQKEINNIQNIITEEAKNEYQNIKEIIEKDFGIIQEIINNKLSFNYQIEIKREEREKEYNIIQNDIEIELNNINKILIEKIKNININKINEEISKLKKNVNFLINKIINFVENRYEYIIKNDFKTIIEYKKEDEEEIDSEMIYKKVKDNYNFDKYYNNWEIKDDIKGKLLAKLFRYYLFLFKFIIDKSIEKYRFNDNKIIYSKKLKYRPVRTLSSFSAMQDLGIWKCKEINNDIKISKRKGVLENLFNNENKNFQKFLTYDNCLLCLKNIDEKTKNNVMKYIEDLSIYYYTCNKLIGEENDALNNIISIFEKIFDSEEIEKEKIIFGSLRFKLMKIMDLENINHHINNINKIEILEKEFKKINCIEGELETMFAKLYIYLKENREKKDKDLIIKNNKKNIYKEILRKIEEIKNNNECKIDEKEKFLKIFECKVKYTYIKYKIQTKIGKFKNENKIKKELEEIAKAFFIEKKYFNEIKTLLLIFELYYVIYNNNKNEENSLIYKENYLKYLNFVLYICLIDYKNSSFKEYIKNYAENKKNLKNRIKYENENKKQYEKILNEVKDLYKNYRKKAKAKDSKSIDFYI